MMSPSAIIATGAGAALAIVVGLPLLAPLVAAAAWAGRVGLSLRRGPRSPEVDPVALSEPWRHHVLDAQDALKRFERTAAAMDAGPLRDTLSELGARLHDGVDDCWRIAERGHEITTAMRSLDTQRAEAELAALRATHGSRPASPAIGSMMHSLEAQLASAARMASVARDADDRLRLLNARLDELCATAVEVSVGATGTQWLSGEVDQVVAQLDALRLAVEEVNAAGAPGTEAPAPPVQRPAPG